MFASQHEVHVDSGVSLPITVPPIPRRLQSAFEPVYRITWLVLGLSLLATVLGWRIVVANIEDRAQDNFSDLVGRFSAELERTITAHEQALAGVAALMRTTPSLSRAKFRSYFEALDVAGNFPGLQGVGFARLFPSSDLDKVEREVRDEGFKSFAVRPAGSRESYSAILFLEPFDWRNQRAFGFDMFSEPVRREAMERARDTGRPAVSGAVELVQETGIDVQKGFLLYFPIYGIDFVIDAF